MPWWPYEEPPAYWGTDFEDYYARQEDAYPSPVQYISHLIQGKLP